MARINLLGTGTTGVDLRTNPLFLGNAKVRFAGNIQFHEGVAKTRPGFSARTLGKSGTLQGFCQYAPSNGLSNQVFGPDKSGIAFVVDGDIFFNDGFNTIAVTTDKPFCNLGAVSLYQAENWLIAQNPAGTTLMWDGYTAPIKSKGMNEVHWDDPDTPWDEAPPVNPVADIPDCDPAPQPWWVKFTVLDSVTLLPIPSAVWSIRRLSAVVFNGVTPVDGTFTVSPAEREYFYSVTAKGYYPKTNLRTTFRRPTNAEERDDCYQVNAASRELLRVVLMTPLPEGWTPGDPQPPPTPDPDPVCSFVIEDVGTGYSGPPSHIYTPEEPEYNTGPSDYGEFTVRNTGTVPLVITGVGYWDPSQVWSHAFPLTVGTGSSVTLSLTTASSDIMGLDFQVMTPCGNVIRIWRAPNGTL
jgi:hypothetical protein